MCAIAGVAGRQLTLQSLSIVKLKFKLKVRNLRVFEADLQGGSTKKLNWIDTERHYWWDKQVWGTVSQAGPHGQRPIRW
jgi:hypothetical protein